MINITVCYATPEIQVEMPLLIEENCTVAIAIKRSGILTQFPEIDFADIQCGIYSKKVKLDDLLHENDRIEIYRPLIIDPKSARQLRVGEYQKPGPRRRRRKGINTRS
jgi:putative ubiquitin-RnfH superfamily antitoxin RatB of RatAB toxin-antitoxin module